MKKFLSMVTVSGLVLVTLAATGVSAFADDNNQMGEITQNDEKNNVATQGKKLLGDAIDVEAGSVASLEVLGEGVLSLDAVPDMNFGTFTAAEMISGTSKFLDKVENPWSVSKWDRDSKEGNDKGLIQVTDARVGENTTWALQVSASEFETKSKDSKLKGGTITLGSDALLAGKEIKLGESAKLLANKTESESAITRYQLTTGGTQLTFDAQKAFKKAIYHSTMTWTLSNTPKA